MSKWYWGFAVLALVTGAGWTSVALAKPSDLPADNDIRCREGRDGNRSGVNPEQSATAQKAHALFEAAERCIKAGDLNQARAHLRAAHMANPTSHYGQRAIQRLLEMETYDASEESEPPAPAADPLKHFLRHILEALPLSPLSEEAQSDEDEPSQAERSFRHMLESTQPLGMIRGQTF